jgi:hypothetical protein
MTTTEATTAEQLDVDTFLIQRDIEKEAAQREAERLTRAAPDMTTGAG